MIFEPVKHRKTGEWRIRKKQLESLFLKENILNTIRNRRLQWAGHAIRSQNSIIRMTIYKNWVDKRPRLRHRLVHIMD